MAKKEEEEVRKTYSVIRTCMHTTLVHAHASNLASGGRLALRTWEGAVQIVIPVFRLQRHWDG